MKKGKADIFRSGKELFYKKGFKDTAVSDITKMTGIAVGTFYNFYSSKEQLFLEIFIKESDKLKKSIVESVDFNDEPVLVAKEIISKLFAGISSNPILKEWYNRDAYNKISQLAETGAWEELDDFSYNLFIDIISKWKTDGKIRTDIDSDLILAFFNALSYIDLHKEEIGKEHFPQIIDHLVEFIVKGLK